ncbi:PREDICTED: uncharacterized protein LOC104603487 [Nelumbo nucifera]|uniref:DUF620 domain-containing protein n=2 Tax=Nelumbo nucifera TaxID=4432 RepID=A0A822YG26_NELNU|nr:PREDICTED: uncharacterized protein LOC104603487 [Nelumbo nucifera]DAD29936.1 TPA_asm: hypothetical protein HUJ06_031404 [Nelumbo nucifera]
MRKLCPNFEREDALETVLEVPIPEEMFASMGGTAAVRWQNMYNWMKSQCADKLDSAPPLGGRSAELQVLLNVVGSPLIPVQVQTETTVSRPIKNCSIEASTAKYIVQQYIAATGGQAALNSVHSMYAIGQVKMSASEFHVNNDCVKPKDDVEIGGFVLWQKNPDLWLLELVVSGCKLSAGSDGKVGWRQSGAQQSHATKGPPRPLRRFFQGLDPRSTANLFSDAMCIGEKVINNEDCFILKLDASAASLKARNTNAMEMIHHTVWGYFSQRTGLMVKFEDSHLVRIKGKKGDSCVFWETSIESVIDDYRSIEGINIAHSGKTSVTLLRYGEGSVNHKRKMEEKWTIEEVDFNVWGLTMDCFLPPSDLKKEGDE